ncbi:protein adenylyltransferase Fic [Vagococcus fluvialis]|uniref:protein adenylyltransferase Fic n=1 Tax=Vagococcus fluvialis TaxID=2738 RepID=UPI001D0A06D4|nr:Fic family protein [Vagococcus fluvialis]UDM79386.1 Fic family protein [Vagococcus fluvialis]
MNDNLLGITNQLELRNEEEKLSKIRAKELFDFDVINDFEVGTYQGLKDIHYYLFQDTYPFAGKERATNLSKGFFQFTPAIYLNASLKQIDKMAMSTFDEIVEKYVEMNIAHPFKDGNGRSTRIWLDIILRKNLKRVIDWNLIDKEDYLLAMERSPIKDIEIKFFLNKALTNKIDDRKTYMTGIDISFYYENFSRYLINEIPR